MRLAVSSGKAFTKTIFLWNIIIQIVETQFQEMICSNVMAYLIAVLPGE